MNSISAFIHVYYPGSWSLIKSKCAWLLDNAVNVIITACHDDVIAEVDMPRAVVLKVTNVGKDIGGKLVSIAYYLTCCKPTTFVMLMHDKISPQSINADFWFSQLYGIFEADKLKRAIRLLSTGGAGIVGAKRFVANEFNRPADKFITTNHRILATLVQEYGLSCNEYNFIAGTIFIARSAIFSGFFSTHSPFAIRETLETGNVLDISQGTYTHAWERMLCFIAQHQGYSVIGV